MTYWETLSQTIQSTIKTDRIGTPVFVRCTAALVDDVADLTHAIGMMVHEFCKWFVLSPNRVYAVGSLDRDQMTVTLEFSSGAMALLTVVLTRQMPQIDLTILGNQGAIYHAEPVQPMVLREIPDQLDEAVFDIVMAIEKSLYVKEPVDLEMAS